MIACSACRTEGQIPKRSSADLPPEVLAKRWIAKGWAVARTASGHVCPDCVARRRPRARETDRIEEEVRSVRLQIVEIETRLIRTVDDLSAATARLAALEGRLADLRG